MFENRALKRIFGRRRERVAEGWRRLHKEELHNLYASPDIVRVIRSGKLKWARHATRMGAMRNEYKILSEIPRRRDHSEDLGVDGKIIHES
jgi:hypothetical protein